MSDLISDSQTELTVNTLLTGRATDDVRDRATAALLVAVQKLTDTNDELRIDIRNLKDSLWSKTKIESMVDERVKQKCRTCPAKVKFDGSDRDGGWKEVVFILLKYGGWVLALLFGLLKISPPSGL